MVTELSDDYDTVMAKEPYVVEQFESFRVPTVAEDEAFDPLTGDLDELTGMLEPTQVMPALSAVLHPTKELSADEEPWWRRTSDTGAA